MTDLALRSATELLRLYRSGAASPLECLEDVLARVHRFEPAVNAFALLDEESARDAARASTERWQHRQPIGLLDGIPGTLKDLVLTKGWPTLRGSRAIDPAGPWEVDSPLAARMKAHGAVIFGKTTTPELGWKGITDSALCGITRNPWNTGRTPGDSSGGAAAAAALGMGALHSGSDGGGSIRIPAGFTGVFGFKPTFGRVPAWPASPFGSVSHLGPITRTVADAALMMNVVSEPDARDWTALPPERVDYRLDLDRGVVGLRIAFAPQAGGVEVRPDVAAAVRSAAAAFETLGARVEEVDSVYAQPDEIFRVHWFAGAATALAAYSERQRSQMDTGLQEVAEAGARIPATEYLDAATARAVLGERLAAFHEDFDLLLTPTLPITAFTAGQEVPEPGRQARWTEWTPFSYPFNLTQQPACTVPCGLGDDGLPVGLQIVGPKYADRRVLAAARAFESQAPFPMPEAPKNEG